MKKRTVNSILILALISFIGIVSIIQIQEHANFFILKGSNRVPTTAALQMDISLSKADASFIGEVDVAAGTSVAIVGDVNNDTYDDILIGAWKYSGFTGKAY
ncbi:MAG: hypothetical protein BAJALOKI1v1_1480007 [Promethearchaeota archaeon]|nr:MAG: hypothetical protein BAJALOKI1v1_1480007 [Candidatus Lokiarchaeota archaeon]